MKKSLLTYLIICFLLLFFPARTSAITDLSVSINPTLVNTNAAYSISFITDKNLNTLDKIFIQFPNGTLLPSSCPCSWSINSFSINGYRPSSVGKESSLQNTIYLGIPGGIKFNTNDKINIDILKSANIWNPGKAGSYNLTLWTTQEGKIQSNDYYITSTEIENLQVDISPDTAKFNASYKISFKIGESGTILAGQNIYIKFPQEVQLPSVGDRDFVTVNDGSPTSVTIDKSVLSIVCPDAVDQLGNVIVFIYPNFNIINPSQAGTYMLSVWTDSEPNPISAQFTIVEQPTVSTLLQADPISPDGTNDYYKTTPTVTLKGETNTTGTVETFYKIDNGDYAQYTQPFTMPEGTHTLYYYSKTSVLQELEETKVFKADTTPPQINIEFPTNDPFYTGDSSILIYGTSSEPVDLIINGKATTLKSDLSFSQEISLNPGDNTITIKATDIAGNSVLKQLKVVFDTTVPVLTVLSPKNWDTISTKEITVKGTVSPSNTDVYISGQKISINSDGTFTYSFVPSSSSSLMPVNVKATYPFSQKTVESTVTVLYQPEPLKLILTIDKNVASVNGVQKTMDVAPFIDASSNRTLVPIRFVSEFLGGTVSWDAQTRTVTINFDKQNLHIKFTVGEKIVYVNGEKKTTDVAPLIRDSRTFAPLRFVAETMGFNVDWDATSHSVTITGS